MATGAAIRARALKWAFAALETVETPLTEIAVIDLFEADAEWARQRRPALVRMADSGLAVLDRVLADKPYLLGDDFTYPDILLATALHELQHTTILEASPTVTSYMGRCDARPPSRRCLAASRGHLSGPPTFIHRNL